MILLRRKRTGISLPENLLQEVDEFISATGIRSRSKIIADALKQYLTEHKLLLEREKKLLGILIVTYNEKRGDTVKRLLDAQHEFLGDIRASLHVHLTHERCLETILIEGQSTDVLKLLEKIENIVGVEMVRFVPAEIIEEDRLGHH